MPTGYDLSTLGGRIRWAGRCGGSLVERIELIEELGERGGCGLQVIARSECVFDEAVAVAVDCSDQVSPLLVAKGHEVDAALNAISTQRTHG